MRCCASDKLCEGAICYTGDILDPARAKYDLKYYVALAQELERAGAHILGIKDMAGLLKPAAARVLVGALKNAVDLPIHFHTHDTSGFAGATIVAAVEAGVDAVDAAMDSMSGTTSQPCLGSLVEALRNTERDTGLDLRRDPAHLVLLGSRSGALRSIRSGSEEWRLGGLSARNAGRPVHQPQRASALARP